MDWFLRFTKREFEGQIVPTGTQAALPTPTNLYGRVCTRDASWWGTYAAPYMVNPSRRVSKMRKAAIVALACVLLLMAGTVQAQGLVGTLRVTVADQTGPTVLDANVTVMNQATNVAVSTTASSAGTYVFPSLTNGIYTITVEKNGFSKYVQKNVQVGASQVTELKIDLSVGAVSSIVEVQAGADLVKTQSSELDTTFEGKVANELPINTNGGSVLEFAVFAPGTTTQQGGVAGSGGSIGGGRPRFHSLYLPVRGPKPTPVATPARPAD